MDSFQLHVAVGYWASTAAPEYCRAAGGMWGSAGAAGLLAPTRHTTQSANLHQVLCATRRGHTLVK